MGTTADKLNRLRQTKADIKAAIEAKGVANVGNRFADYAAKIGEIQSGGGGDLDFSKIGYEGAPQYLIDGLAYAEEIQREWNPNVPHNNSFKHDLNLVFLPNLISTTSLDENKIFEDCTNLMFAGDLDLSKSERTDSLFNGCSSLISVGNINVEKTLWSGFIFANCRKLESIKSFTIRDFDAAMHSTFNGCVSLRFLVFKGIGTHPSQTGIRLTESPWGVNNNKYPNARQSLVDSLITYSFDRNSAGYSVATLTLSAETKAVLTEEEKTQITNKGYTIA